METILNQHIGRADSLKVGDISILIEYYHSRDVIVDHLVSGTRVAVVLLNYCVSLGENGLARSIFFGRIECHVQFGLIVIH